jgi:hypothetical protein
MLADAEAIAHDVVGEVQSRNRLGEERMQALLAFDQRLVATARRRTDEARGAAALPEKYGKDSSRQQHDQKHQYNRDAFQDPAR